MSARKLIVFFVALGAAVFGVLGYSQRKSETAGGPASAPEEEQVTQDATGPVARITEAELADGFVPLIRESEDGSFNKHGWNHYGPGWFTLDHGTGILTSHGGMGLLWYSAEMFGDFTLRLEFRTSKPESNSGVFLRVPELVTSDEYIYHSFEIQIDARGDSPIHRTGAVYDAEPPSEDRTTAPGAWNDMEISFVGDRISVSVNGGQVVDWVAEPRGKIRDFAARGYIGLQNHDWDSSVYFRNVRVKKLD
ncbi:MAG: DUF1080 domain-containing protein [Candidatus Palauibacterales bacterium]|nr:DUF1080 domain-containing protein [Candidatus Palauibacterales bacterium]MDP2482726.1 DUF1080 domain-containing protein [Candidatus Palauibacterales bacterium]